MVLGQPTTVILALVRKKYSASTAAFVFESSPPIITIALISCVWQTLAQISNCSSVSSLVRPLPIISKPPVLRYSCMSSVVISSFLSSNIPEGPPKKPNRRDSGFAFFKASNSPLITLWPPGACPPERITPMFIFFATFAEVPLVKFTWGNP